MANNLKAAIRSEKFLKDLVENDLLLLKRRAYFLSGAVIKSDVECYAQNCLYKVNNSMDVSLSSAFGGMAVSNKTYAMMFCFSCNRTYHCACINLTAERLKIEPVPWICYECVTNEENCHAKEYYASNLWQEGIAARRKRYMDEKCVTNKPSLRDVTTSDEELDSTDEMYLNQTSLEDKSFSETVPVAALHHQRLEFQKLTEMYEKVEEERDHFLSRSQELEKELKMLKKRFDDLEIKVKTSAEGPRVRIQDTTQAIPSSVLSSTRHVAQQSYSVLTVKEMLAQKYLRKHSEKRDSTSSSANGNAECSENRDVNLGSINYGRNNRTSLASCVGNLSTSDPILFEQTQIQRETSMAQREMTNTMSLELRRKSLPKICKFSGEPKDWIKFKRDVKRYQEIGKFDDDLMKMYILQSLEGLALERVQDLIDTAPLHQTMKMLEEGFGEASRIIEKCAQEILNIRLERDLFRDDVMLINTKIQAYFSACQYAEIDYANTNHLAKHIFDQFNTQIKQFFRHHFRSEYPNEPNKLINLESMFSFLEDLSKDLEDKRKPDRKDDKAKSKAHVLVTTVANQSTPRGNDDYMFEIRDKATATYIGYDMNVVNSIARKCECCGKNNHYSLQCRTYRSMEGNARLKLVAEKGLCKNCLLSTTHRSAACVAKSSCGFRDGSFRCSQKHHITLHKVLSNGNNRIRNRSNNGNGNRPIRRGNTNANTRRASDIMRNNNSSSIQEQSDATANNATNVAPSINMLPSINSSRPGAVTSSTAQIHSTSTNTCQPTVQSNNAPVSFNVLPYNMPRQLNVTSFGVQRTVKVFKNKFLGTNGYVLGYSVGDSAAEVTLVREDLRKALDIEGESCELDLQWTDNSLKKVKAMRINLSLQGVHKNAEKLILKNCYAVEDLDLPKRSLDMKRLKEQFPHLRNVKFDGYQDVSPWLLIGSPHASVIEANGKLFEDGEGKPVGLLAKLGWCVYGGCPEEFSDIPYSIQTITKGTETKLYEPPINEGISNEELFKLFSFFSSVESLGVSGKTEHATEDEQKALEIVKEEMRSLPDGTIEVPLVWNRDGKEIPRLPNNFPMVLKRQLAQEVKLKKNPEHLLAYNENFKELLREGYARPATNEDIYGIWPNVYYLPMSLVINANKIPVKYRNVFDASAKYNGTSLNENLLKGPDLLVNLVYPILRMRENRVAFTADIKAMFMRMKVNERDQQCQRILWREDPNDDLRVYVMTSVLFGPTCSPFESQIVKNETAEKWKDEFPEAANTIQEDMYMDDLLSSAENVGKAIKIAKECISIFQSINWHLISFQSNSIEFMKALPEANAKQELIPLLENENESCTTKVLGCMWEPKIDCFVFKFDKNVFVRIVKELNHRPTKRDQSSTIARIFDVLGLISHYVIRGKILLQRSWQNNLGWDDEISENDQVLWKKWLDGAEDIAKLKIPRMYANINSLSKADLVEIHVFCDAGDEAFAAVAYMVVTSNGRKESNIIMAKARVAPLRLKSQTKICEMPRLELYAALIAARLIDTISKGYNHLKCKRYLWSDSEVVLRWLLNSNHKLLKYAISPVEEILEKTERSEWRYVPSKLNSADIATKFKKFDFKDSQSMWFTGPAFIRMNQIQWPAMPNLEPKKDVEKIAVNSVNIKNLFSFSSQKLPSNNCPFAMDSQIDTLSSSIRGSWPKLVRATARALKLYFEGLIPLVKSKKFHDIETRRAIKALSDFSVLTPSDYERAELFLIRKTQKEAMPEVYKKLANNQQIMEEELKQLNVFIDKEGVIRINSRVDLGPEIYPQRFAPFLPRKTALTRVLLYHFHYEFRHVCLESQIAAVRSKFWIPQLRTAFKSIKAHCNVCNIRKALPYAPLMAPLPEFRVNPEQTPFEVVGLDCAGPINVMLHTVHKEVYILIFTCTLTRFIHLHLLESLQTTRVLEAIALFWSCHGPVRTFLSDNGRNFTGAGKFLKEQNEILGGHLVEKYRCDWKFIPAHSPWMGAFYERLIKEVKRAIEHVLVKQRVQKIELNIALQDAAHRLNCRPLTHNAVSADDGPILTPHLLAKGRDGWPLLPGLRTEIPIPDHKKDRNVYRRGRAIADAIMRKFVSGYLPELTRRTKWLNEREPLKIDDLVLIIEPNQTRQQWQRGRIVRVYKSRDKRTRVADVMRHDGVLKVARSIQRLAKINISRVEDAC